MAQHKINSEVLALCMPTPQPMHKTFADRVKTPILTNLVVLMSFWASLWRLWGDQPEA
jgi:hypothetical protein